MQKPILVTGGLGFIGSNFILQTFEEAATPILNLDNLTYAANPGNLKALEGFSGYEFIRGGIAERELVRALLSTYKPSAVVHFAAESHVDRSILGPEPFIRTNVDGTFCLLEESKAYWEMLEEPERQEFRFLHVSTDEVYGSLGPNDPPFTEETAYAPNSPYSASKAASDHLVRAYYHTYGLPTLITNCSNNYGPLQFPEKLIPLMTCNAIKGQALPVYGDGGNVRDWLFVRDHCTALRTVLEYGRVGERYNIGGNAERTNLDVVSIICRILDELWPRSIPGRYEELITFVKDRPGHDRRYAVDTTKIQRELGWSPQETFESGLKKTVAWYLSNPDWVEKVSSGAYRDWVEIQYAER